MGSGQGLTRATSGQMLLSQMLMVLRPGPGKPVWDRGAILWRLGDHTPSTQSTLCMCGRTMPGGPMLISADERTIAGGPVSISGDQRTIAGGPMSISGDQRTIAGRPMSISGDQRTIKTALLCCCFLEFEFRKSTSGDQRTIAGGPMSIPADQSKIAGGPMSISGDLGSTLRGWGAPSIVSSGTLGGAGCSEHGVQ